MRLDMVAFFQPHIDDRLSELQAQITNTKTRHRQDKDRLSSQLNSLKRELSGLKKRRRLQIRAEKMAASQLRKYQRLTGEYVTSQLELNNARSNDINQRLALETIDQQIITLEGSIAEISHNLIALTANEEREISQICI